MLKKLAVFVVASVAFLAAGLLTAVGFLARNHWFGSGDLRAFLYWSLYLMAPIVLLCAVYGHIARKMNRVPAFLGSAIVGGGLGYLATFAVWKMLGMWFGAFSFPLFYCWLAGAIAACVVATALARMNATKPAPLAQ